MKKGFQNGAFLCALVDVMCQRLETDTSVPQKFDISDLLTKEEWEDSTTYYGHSTIGALFCRRVETGKVKGVCKTGKKTSRGLTEYKRI